LRGNELTKEATTGGPPKSPKDIAVPAAKYNARPRASVLIDDPKATRGEYVKVFLASGKAAPARVPDGKLVHLPYTDMLNADGTPKSARELWTLIAKAGVLRHAEVVLFADDPAEAAVNYHVFRLMGWPDVKVRVNR